VITTAIRQRRIERACFHLTRFDASKKLTCQFFVVVVSQSNRKCDIGFRRRLWEILQCNPIFLRKVAVWLSGNALVSVNEVTLRGCRCYRCLDVMTHDTSGPTSTWMGDRLRTDKPSPYATSHPGQLSLAIPPWVGTMTTSESWGVNGHTARYTSPVSMVSQCKLVWLRAKETEISAATMGGQH